MTSFRDNLHWPIHSTNGNAIMTPVGMAPNCPASEQLARVAWVYDYAMEAEPARRKQRFDAALRKIPGQALMQPTEFYGPEQPKHVSPWTQEGIAGRTQLSARSKNPGPNQWCRSRRLRHPPSAYRRTFLDVMGRRSRSTMRFTPAPTAS